MWNLTRVCRVWRWHRDTSSCYGSLLLPSHTHHLNKQTNQVKTKEGHKGPTRFLTPSSVPFLPLFPLRSSLTPIRLWELKRQMRRNHKSEKIWFTTVSVTIQSRIRANVDYWIVVDFWKTTAMFVTAFCTLSMAMMTPLYTRWLLQTPSRITNVFLPPPPPILQSVWERETWPLILCLYCTKSIRVQKCDTYPRIQNVRMELSPS